MTIGEKDKRAWELIKAVPRLSKSLGYICAVINLVIVGLGTIIAAFQENHVNKTQLIVGIT